MKYKKIDNPGLGLCHILKENNYGYLIYSENNFEHFIVTIEINDTRFIYNEYFKTIDEALNYLNNMERIETNNENR